MEEVDQCGLSPWCCIWLLLVTFPLLPSSQDVRSTTLKHPPPGWTDASENINQSKASLSWTASVKCSSHNDEQVTIRAYLSSNQLERLGRGRWFLCLDEITGRREEEHGRECFSCTTYKLKSCLLSNINKCGKHYNKTAIIKKLKRKTFRLRVQIWGYSNKTRHKTKKWEALPLPSCYGKTSLFPPETRSHLRF